MGTLLDSSVLIRLERSGSLLTIGDNEEVAIAAITASELLHGVHRADPQRRAQREAFVEHAQTFFCLPRVRPTCSSRWWTGPVAVELGK